MLTRTRITTSLCLAALVSLTGCGGLGPSNLGGNNGINGNNGNNGNGGGNTRTAQVKVDITWAARSKVVNAPSSALSAVFTLQGAKVGGGDFTFEVDRADAPATYTQTAVSQQQAVVGNWNMTVQFYSSKGGQGSVVATGGKAVTLNADGTGIGDVAATPVIASAAVVLPNQSLSVGQNAKLSFSALDANGKPVTVTPGSAFFTVASGTDKLQVSSDGTITALAAGTATVTVTIDGKTSPPQSIDVLPSLSTFEAPSPGKQVMDTSTALTTHLSQVATTIPSAAMMAQVTGQVGATGAFTSQATLFLDLAKNASPLKIGSGVYNWTYTANGLTIIVALDESQAQTAQWKVTLNGQLGSYTLNNLVYVAGTYKRDSLNGKAGYHLNTTFNDLTGSGKSLATDDIYIFDDATSQAAFNIQNLYQVNWQYRADKSWYYSEFQSTNGAQQKLADTQFNADGSGAATDYCSQDNAAQSTLTYTSLGAHGTVTEHATACGGTEGKQVSW